jgi:hypothetical protein
MSEVLAGCKSREPLSREPHDDGSRMQGCGVTTQIFSASVGCFFSTVCTTSAVICANSSLVALLWSGFSPTSIPVGVGQQHVLLLSNEVGARKMSSTHIDNR